MSYWFEEPHTLVQLEARSDSRTGGKILLSVFPSRTTRGADEPPREVKALGQPVPHELLVSLAGSITMALQRRIEAFNQCPGVERLTQEAGCSGFQCLRPDILLGESRDEDDRQPVSLRLQKSLQLDSAHAWHLNIRDHAGGVIQLG